MVRRHQVRDGPIRVVAGALGIFYIVCVCVGGGDLGLLAAGRLWGWGQASCVPSFLGVASLCP